jgi:uncharacterized membrane protein YedE/YeeE
MATAFTPLASLAGGILIGMAAVLLMMVHGRIAGATGILTGALLPSGWVDWSWRAAVIGGMIAAPMLTFLVTGAAPVIMVPVSTASLVIGGLIVGVGVMLGSGCTSGHGVCGMARLSPRSIAATVMFMAATFVTVFIVRHGLGG